ncbi:MAG: penicillin-insensitive murein endopeptidase [Pseudomonadota bacterium]
MNPRPHIRLLLALACLPVLAGCPRPAEADLPLYEEVFLTQRPDPPAPARDGNWTLDRVLSDDIDDEDIAAVPTPADPAVAWRSLLFGSRSVSVGKSSKGSLRNGRRMPKRGDGFIRKNDKAAWGTDETIALLSWAATEMTRRYPGTVPMVVGDISDENGRRLRPHLSHQSGRDADVGYYFVGNQRVGQFRTATCTDLDVEKTWTLIELLLSTGQVKYFFIDRRFHKLLFHQALAMGWAEEEARGLFEAPVGKSARSGLIRHIPGHKHHLHVRFRCPEGDECGK